MSRAHTTPDLTDAYREQCYKMQQCPHCGAQDCITTTTDRKKISRHWHIITRYSCGACQCSGAFSKREDAK